MNEPRKENSKDANEHPKDAKHWEWDSENPGGASPDERSEDGVAPPDAVGGGGLEGEPVGPEGPHREAPTPENWEPDPQPPNLKARPRGRAMAKPPEKPVMPLTPQQKILLLDLWNRSGLPARDFGALVNVSRHTLYAWKRKFELEVSARRTTS